MSVYSDCIAEVVGKVFIPPLDVKQTTISSLVHTTHNIPRNSYYPIDHPAYTHKVFTVFAVTL